jgi:hypothetical protein
MVKGRNSLVRGKGECREAGGINTSYIFIISFYFMIFVLSSKYPWDRMKELRNTLP